LDEKEKEDEQSVSRSLDNKWISNYVF